jgi:apolipoprotein N-acyltransferase
MHLPSFSNGLRKDLAALAAGALFPFSLAPFDYTSLALISLAVLFMAWEGAGLSRATLRGFLFGLGQFSVGLYWVYVTLYNYAATTSVEAFLITFAFICLLAGFPALAGLMGVFLRPAMPAIRLIVVYPALWIFTEWLRAWMEFPGCPWLQVGYSQLQSIPGAIAPVLGQYGVGLFAVMTVGTVIYSARSDCPHRKIALAGLSVAWCLTAFFQGHHWTEPVGQPVKVSLLQGNIPQELKWLSSTTRQTLRWYIDHTVDHWDSDLIVWPETAVPVHYHNLKSLFDELGEEAVQEKASVLIGVPIYDQETQKKFNGAVAIGLGQGRYLKRHLLPFGEYIPFPGVAGYVAQFMEITHSDFSPGDMHQSPVYVAGLPVGVSICYEDVFGQEILSALPDALFLVNLTNDGWFGHTIALDQNLQMARMRSLETGRYMIRATNTGLTAIISAGGEIVSMAPRLEAAVLTGTVQPMQGITPYALVGDSVVLVLIGLALSLAFALPRRGTSTAQSDPNLLD